MRISNLIIKPLISFVNRKIAFLRIFFVAFLRPMEYNIIIA
nr:MAG TPA: hypothetical protein [Caudoviricetes sp.]